LSLKNVENDIESYYSLNFFLFSLQGAQESRKRSRISKISEVEGRKAEEGNGAGKTKICY
jgi:hypothetical protein